MDRGPTGGQQMRRVQIEGVESEVGSGSKKEKKRTMEARTSAAAIECSPHVLLKSSIRSRGASCATTH